MQGDAARKELLPLISSFVSLRGFFPDREVGGDCVSQIETDFLHPAKGVSRCLDRDETGPRAIVRCSSELESLFVERKKERKKEAADTREIL